MPTGIPNAFKGNKAALLDRIKELEAHLKQIDRREKKLADLKKWLATRKLDFADLAWMYQQMKPQREATPIKSKRPLQPKRRPPANGGYIEHGRLMAPKGDPEFHRRVREARKQKGWSAADLGKKIGVTNTTITGWEIGRRIPDEVKRAKVVKALDLPASLGAAASKANGQG